MAEFFAEPQVVEFYIQSEGYLKPAQIFVSEVVETEIEETLVAAVVKMSNQRMRVAVGSNFGFLIALLNLKDPNFFLRTPSLGFGYVLCVRASWGQNFYRSLFHKYGRQTASPDDVYAYGRSDCILDERIFHREDTCAVCLCCELVYGSCSCPSDGNPFRKSHIWTALLLGK